MLVDTHCHLNLEDFTGDLDEVIQRASGAGVRKIIIPGVDFETSRRAIEISHTYENVFAAVGIHPNYAQNYGPRDVEEISALAVDPKVVAIGEIGLDLYRDFAPLPHQIALLEMQLELAKNRSLPIIIHSRKATAELAPILTAWQKSLSTTNPKIFSHPGVMHAFEGTLEEAHAFASLGFVFGLGGALTYKPTRVDQRLVATLPLTSFVFETDSPYLTPNPFRGKRNEPAFMVNTVQFLSAQIGVDFEELCKISTETANNLFHLEQY